MQVKDLIQLLEIKGLYDIPVFALAFFVRVYIPFAINKFALYYKSKIKATFPSD